VYVVIVRKDLQYGSKFVLADRQDADIYNWLTHWLLFGILRCASIFRQAAWRSARSCLTKEANAVPIEIKGSVSVDTLIVSIGIHLTQSLALPISHLHGRLSWTPKMGQLAKVEPCP
jgi:hypothetical protein